MEQIVHLDIKHKNILIGSKGNQMPKVKLADFGLACYLEDGECFRLDAGTLGYKAPEIILKQPSDFKSDIWSLGVILYDLLCGEMPFAGQTINEVKESILTMDLDFTGEIWATISEPCIDLLRNMLNRDQEARYDIADVLLHPWVIQKFSDNE